MAQHCREDDFWCILHGKVYDLTAYLEYHPGGPDILLEYAGKDISAAFGKQGCFFSSSLPLVDDHHAWVNYETLLDTCLRGFLVF